MIRHSPRSSSSSSSSTSSSSSSASSSGQATPLGSPRQALPQPAHPGTPPLALNPRNLGPQHRELTTVRQLAELASPSAVWTVDQLERALNKLDGSFIVLSSTPPRSSGFRDDLDLILDRYEAVARAIGRMQQAGALSQPSPELARAMQAFDVELLHQRAMAAVRANRNSGFTG